MRWTLVSGSGLTWMDFAIWAFRRNGSEVILVPAVKDGPLTSRDLAVFQESDAYVLIAARRGGTMAGLAEIALEKGKLWVVVAPGSKESLANLEWVRRGAKAIECVFNVMECHESTNSHFEDSEDDRKRLWHFTRTCSGPWPGESEGEYFESLAMNLPGACHRASDALDRILREKRIRSSGKLIRGEYPVVCFSEESPSRLLELRRFRKSLLRWDFEPAAIGFPRSWAEEAGVRPVRYLPTQAFRELHDSDGHLFQKHDPPGVDYSHEKEWRSLGDFDFARLDVNNLRVFLGDTK